MTPDPSYAYILASERNGALYVGSTTNLPQRIWQHKTGAIPGHTKTYGIKTLVWYQQFPSIVDARAYEKRIKRWLRKWKLELIEEMNPQWKDLYPQLNG